MNDLIYVIAGKEDSLVNAECRELLDKLIEPSQRDTGLYKPAADSATASEVLDELRTAPFLTNKRVVLIQSADDFISRNRELLEKYFDNPCSTGRLVLTVRSWDSRTKLAKKLSKAGKLINVTTPKPWELPQRLTKYAQEAYGKKMDGNAARLLIELTGDELTRLYSEIDKLALYADTEKIISTKHIESLIGHNRVFGAFEVIDEVIGGNAGKAIGRLRAMFEADKSAEYTIVGAFAYHLRRMFGVKVLLEKGMRIVEIERKMHIWSNKEKFFTQLRRVTLRQIARYIQQLAETDYAIKTGRTKAPVAMEQFVLRLTGGATH
jgi:DNA polymerase-3 subunit delta